MPRAHVDLALPLVGRFVGDPAQVRRDDGVGLGVRESDGELLVKLDAAISSMKADGSLNALIEKWGVGEQF